MSTMSPSERGLIANDNVDAAELTAAYLSLLGYEVRVVHDGGAVLEAAASFEPRAVVLDIGLPTIDGLELARRLRAIHGSALKLIAATGYGQKSDHELGRGAGFDAYLVKPVDLDDLAAELRKR